MLLVVNESKIVCQEATDLFFSLFVHGIHPIARSSSENGMLCIVFATTCYICLIQPSIHQASVIICSVVCHVRRVTTSFKLDHPVNRTHDSSTRALLTDLSATLTLVGEFDASRTEANLKPHTVIYHSGKVSTFSVVSDN